MVLVAAGCGSPERGPQRQLSSVWACLASAGLRVVGNAHPSGPRVSSSVGYVMLYDLAATVAVYANETAARSALHHAAGLDPGSEPITIVQIGNVVVAYLFDKYPVATRRTIERCAFGAKTGATPTTVNLKPAPIPVQIPGGLDRTQAELFTEGRRIAASSGCLACHRIGTAGNDGPGPNLNGIGTRLPPPAIARGLRDPVAPMPSYRNLPAAEFKALVVFLANLR